MRSHLGRWAIYLSGVKYTIKCRPGRVHENTDFLSRIPIASIDARPTLLLVALESKDPTRCVAIFVVILTKVNFPTKTAGLMSHLGSRNQIICTRRTSMS